MKRKKFYKRLLQKNIYVNDYSYKMTQKRQTKVSSFFQIKSTKQGKVTFLTFSLNLILSNFPHTARTANDDVVSNNSDNATQSGRTTSASNEITATQEKASAGNFSI